MAKKVIIGGTFDLLHVGHKALIKKAFDLGEVKIGLVVDTMAETEKERKVSGFEDRKRELVDFIKNEIGAKPFIFPIYDKFGPTLEEDFDYIVISPETYETALVINAKRETKKKKPIKIVKINYVLTDDGQPVSSTRIATGEIDREGRLFKCKK